MKNKIMIINKITIVKPAENISVLDKSQLDKVRGGNVAPSICGGNGLHTCFIRIGCNYRCG